MTNPLFDALLKPHLGHDAVLLQMPDGTTCTHRDMLVMSAQIANALSVLGARPGDRVAVQVAKSPQALAIYFACIQAGLVLLPLNPDYTIAELNYFIADATPALLISDPSSTAELVKVAEQHGVALSTLDGQGQGAFRDLVLQQPETYMVVDRKNEDLAAILYTSGTTGRPKGAMLSHGNLLSNAQALVVAWRFSADDVLLHALPIFHTHGLFVAVNVTLLAGGAMVFLPRFDLDEVLAVMPECTTMMGVPTFYTRLLARDDFVADLTAHMRLFVSGSAPLLAETHAAFEQCTGQVILERYGMTETSMITSNPYGGVRRAGTVGQALDGVEVIITDPKTGEPLETGKIGMVQVRGPNVFRGYWNMPKKTAEELQENGFFITGDLGCFSEDGYLEIVGRSKDLIISGGFNIYPKEVEVAIDLLDGVSESAVIGIPHPDLGEATVAIIVKSENADINEAIVLNKLNSSLAVYKHPRNVYFLAKLPRNAMGKVQKNMLRESLPRFVGK
ncbi:MAG: malonyl-CoA synthase [Paracoccaceae bacterium]